VVSHSIKEALRKHWKWLAVSALAVGSITLSCGRSESSTNLICTSITRAIALLLSHTETPTNAPKNNTKMDTLFHPITHFDRMMYKNSFGHSEKARLNSLKNKNAPSTKSAISIAESMATKTNALTIISVSSTISLTTKPSGRMTRVSTHILQKNLKNFGRGDSPRSKRLTSRQRRTVQNTHSKKLPAKKQKNTICDAMKMAKPTGYFQNISACQLAEKNPAA